MGENTANTGQPDTRGGEEVMNDADVGFGDNLVVVMQQVIVVFVDRAVNGVFDGDHCGIAVA
jgi:hypothetical protein